MDLHLIITFAIDMFTKKRRKDGNKRIIPAVADFCTLRE
jgi:hypothetical protein